MLPLRRLFRQRAPIAAAILPLALLPLHRAPAAAQPLPTGEAREAIFVGAEAEAYLRLLQVTGRTPSYPWSIRSFSPVEVGRLVPADSAAEGHPWEERWGREPRPAGIRLEVVPPRARAVYNSSLPHGSNDGVTWAGKGVTATVTGGGGLRWNAFSITLAPVVVATQNAAFEMVANGMPGEARFGNYLYPGGIDLPRRFGEESFVRVDPGESTIRWDRGVTIGLSSASQHWGPAAEFPLVLGNNAGGFPHVFVGTARPVNVGVGRLHARLVWGSLAQSVHTNVPADSADRFASGMAVVLQPRLLDGLEVGGARFFHLVGSPGEVRARDALAPLGGILKGSGPEQPGFENQIASVFARWVVPAGGVEVYGEYAREDHSATLRDLVLEPDHMAAFTVGFRKVWERGGGWTVLRGEWMDARNTHLRRVRNQAAFYTHHQIRQGHTHRGQALASPAAFGGAGKVLALDRYTGAGRYSVSWRSAQVAERFSPGPEEPHVEQVVGVEAHRLVRGVHATAGLRAVWELNREFRDDAFNLNASLELRARL